MIADSSYTDRSGQDPTLQWSAVPAFPSTSRDPDEEPDSTILDLSQDFSDMYQAYTPSRIMESIHTLSTESGPSDAVSVSESGWHGFAKAPDDGGTLWTPRALNESSASYNPYAAHTTQPVSTTTLPLVQDHGMSRRSSASKGSRYQDSTTTHSDADVPQEVSYLSLAEEPPQAVGRNVTAVSFNELGAQVISAYLSNAHSISCLQKFKECIQELKTVMQRNSATADSSLWSAEIPYALQDITEELFNPEATGGNSFLSWGQRSFSSLQCSCDDAFGSSRVTATDRPCMPAVREMSEYQRIPGTPGSLPVAQQNTGFSEERDSSPAAKETSLTVSTVKDSNWTRESFCMWVQESLHDSTRVLDYTSADSDCTIPYPVENECSCSATRHTAKSSICHGSISQHIVRDPPSTTVGQSSEHENSVLEHNFITKRQCSSTGDSSHFQPTPTMQRPESGLGDARAEAASPPKLISPVSRFQASATLPIFLSSTTRDISPENRDSVLEHTSTSSGFRARGDLTDSVPGVVNQSKPHTAKANSARKRKTNKKERQALSDTFSVPNPTHLSMPESPRCRQMPHHRAAVQETASPDRQAKMEVSDAQSNRRQQPDGNSFSQPLAVLLVVAEDSSLPSESSSLQALEQSSNTSVLCVRQTRDEPLLDDEDIQAGAVSLITPCAGPKSSNAEFVSTSSFHPQRDRHPPKAESTRLDSPQNVKLNIQRPYVWAASERPAESRRMPARRTHNQNRHATTTTVPEESDPDNGLSSSGKESSWTPGTASYCGSDSDPDTCRKLSRPNKRTTSSSSSRHKRGHTRGRAKSSWSLTRRPRVSDCPNSAASSKKITAKRVPAESQSTPHCDGPRKGRGTKRGQSEPQVPVSESVSHGASADPHHSALPPKKRHCKMLLSRLSKNLWHCGGGQGNASNMTVSYLPPAPRTGLAAGN